MGGIKIKDIIFVTGNNSKFEWAKRRLEKFGVRVIQKNIEINEPRAFEVEELIKTKLKNALNQIKPPFIIEDTSFQIKALNDFPSTYIKLAIEKLGVEKLCNLMLKEKDRTVCFKSGLGYTDEEGKEQIFLCEDFGIMPESPRGKDNKGFNDLFKIFIPKGFSKTLAEMSNEEFKKYEEKIEERDHFIKFIKFLKL